MPLPNPKSDESKDDYISRFMSWWSDEDSDMDKDQALAAAYDKWDKKSQDDDSGGKVARHLVDFIEESAGKVADRWSSMKNQSGQPKEAMLKQAATEETEKADDELVEKMLNEYPGLMESVAKAIEGGAKDIIIKNRTGTTRPRSPMPGIGLGGGGLRGIPDGTGPMASMGMCRSMPLKLEKESADGGSTKCQCPECGHVQSKPSGESCEGQTCNNCGHEGMVDVGEKQAKMVSQDVKQFLKEAEGNFLDKGMNWLKENPRALYGLFGGGVGSLIGGLAGGRGGALAGLGIGGGFGYLGGKQMQNKVAPWLRELIGGKESSKEDSADPKVDDQTRMPDGSNQPSESRVKPVPMPDGSRYLPKNRAKPVPMPPYPLPKNRIMPVPMPGYRPNGRVKPNNKPEDSRYSDLNITDEEKEKIISERQHGRGGVPPHLQKGNAPDITIPQRGIRIPF